MDRTIQKKILGLLCMVIVFYSIGGILMTMTGGLVFIFAIIVFAFTGYYMLKGKEFSKNGYIAVGLLSLFYTFVIGLFSIPLVLELINIYELGIFYLAEPVLVMLIYVITTVLCMILAFKK